MENANSNEYLEKIKNAVVENLKKTAAPSVQMQDVPRQSLGGMTDEDDAMLDDLDVDENKDVRMTQRRWEKHVARDDEFEESDDEEMAGANGVYQVNGKGKSIMDHKNPDAPDDFSRAPTPEPLEAPSSPEPEIEEEVDTNEGDETMEDVDAGVPEEPIAEGKAEDVNPAPQDTTTTAGEVRDGGDVDMTEAAEPAEAPAIKEEEAEVQPPTAAAEPISTNNEPSDKVAIGSSAADQPAESTSETRDSPKAPVLAAAETEKPELTDAPVSPTKPAEASDASASKTDGTLTSDGADKPDDGAQPTAPAGNSTED